MIAIRKETISLREKADRPRTVLETNHTLDSHGGDTVPLPPTCSIIQLKSSAQSTTYQCQRSKSKAVVVRKFLTTLNNRPASDDTK